MAGKQTFNIAYTARKVFDIVIENFSLSLAWFQTLKIKRIKFTITQTGLLSRIIQTLKIKKMKIAFDNSLIKILARIPVTVNIKKIKFTILLSALEGWTQSVKIKRIKFVMASFRTLLRIATANLSIKKIKIVADATVAIFYALSYWDPYYLSDLDGYLLSDMEYVIV